MARVSEEELDLLPEPASAALARRLVRDFLTAVGRAEWADAAELAVSELVTNVVLHAHTGAHLTLTYTGDELRVSVEDRSAVLPSQRQYGQQATTGRGMALIAAITSSHGVTPLEDGGKAVWFTLGGAAGPADLLQSWADDDSAPSAASPSSAARATLVGLPPTLWLAAAQHQDALLRELALFRAGAGLAADDLAAADRARFAVRGALDSALAEARAQGRARNPLPADHPASLDDVPETLDVEVDLPGEDPTVDLALLQDVLDEAERLAVDELLLARPSLPEVIAVRDWAAESLIAQLAGQPPSPWAGTAAERFAHELDDAASDVDWDLSLVRDSERGAVAADEGNRILAVSRPLAAVLGWVPEDLIGRRIVAIVPPQYREAHVAGFTRHLTTGQAHALNVPLDLPVLRADGTEVTCGFFIEAHRSARGRNVYVAWVTPHEAG